MKSCAAPMKGKKPMGKGMSKKAGDGYAQSKAKMPAKKSK